MENLPSDLFCFFWGGGVEDWGQRSIDPSNLGRTQSISKYIYSQQLLFILNTFKCHNITHSWSVLH